MNPKLYKKTHHQSESEQSYSSSDYDTDSSDDFPSPSTPVKHRGGKSKHDSKDDMSEKVKYLQRKLYEMEIKNRKLKTKAGRS